MYGWQSFVTWSSLVRLFFSDADTDCENQGDKARDRDEGTNMAFHENSLC
jgi:hypothetical protein